MASAIAQQAVAVCSAPAQRQAPRASAKAFVGASVQRKHAFLGRSIVQSSSKQQQGASRSAALKVFAVRDGTPLDRPLRVAVIGGGPSGACCAEVGGDGSRLAGRRKYRTRRRRQARAALRAPALTGNPPHCLMQSLAKGGVEAFLIERKMDNCKVGLRKGWFCGAQRRQAITAAGLCH